VSKSVSILVPVYNSSAFLHKLLEAIDEQRIKENWKLEVVLVDDGSRDNSYDRIVELTKTYPYIKGIKLSKNFGHQIAVKTALSYSTGEYVAIIDDDLQDPPSLLPRFFTYLDKGYDVAYGVRKKRKESIIKKFFYSTFYKILQGMSNIHIPLDSGDFCVMKRKVVDSMLKLPEQNPFLRGMRAWVGFKQIGVEYERAARLEGESGYTLRKLLRIAMDGIFSFSSAPIRLITILGVIGLSFALVYSFLVIKNYLVHGIGVRGFSTVYILICFFSSLVLICLGVIGEYIVRIYDEVRQRPYVVIDESVNV
jgi:glycosyltransferase involved in cell wall biosynthesis